MKLKLYNFLSLILFPFLLIKFIIFDKKIINYFYDFKARFNGNPIENKNLKDFINNCELIWVHAVSLGESHASIPLIEKLIKNNPKRKILITSTTKTGWQAIENYIFLNKLNRNISHQICPYDFFWAIRKFIKIFSPKVLILIETEIWPNIICEANKRNIKVVLASARLSSKSLKKFLFFKSLSCHVLNKISAVLVQTNCDAKNFKYAGFKKKPLTLGNLKFDISLDEKKIQTGKIWREKIIKKYIWLALSTREGEEKNILQAWLEKGNKNDLLILLPRHPERFQKVFIHARNLGFKVKKKSFIKTNFIDEKNLAESDVLIGDSLGEVQFYISMSDLILIGGSINNLGGQSPIDACAQGKPVFFGKNMYNFSSVANELVCSGGGIEIKDYNLWITIGNKLLINKGLYNKTSCASRSVFSNNQGASEKIVENIEKIV